MPDGPVARFSVDKAILEKIVPREGLIGYVEPTLPRIISRDVVRVEVDRGDKSVVLERNKDRWNLKDASGTSPADQKRVDDFVRKLADAGVRRWVKNLDAKDDLEPYGLKTPGLKVAMTLKQDKMTAETVASALAQLGNAMSDPSLTALGAAWSNLQLGGERVVISFGKDATEKEDAGHVFVQHSKTDRLGVAPTSLTAAIRNTDFRDRATVLAPQVRIAAGLIGTAGMPPVAGLLGASPLATCQLGRADASKVTDLQVTVRTPFELRTFRFARKNNAWVDATGIKEFHVDEEHVNEIANLAARIDFNRIVQLDGGPKADQRLAEKDATVVIDAFIDLRPVKLVIGANYDGYGYFAQSSTWPGAVFMIRPDRVQPILRGIDFFAKERTN